MSANTIDMIPPIMLQRDSPEEEEVEEQDEEATNQTPPTPKDPKETKRRQNRVAQRLYRQRMKARMEALQARLDRIEGNNRQTGRTTNRIDKDFNYLASTEPYPLIAGESDPQLPAPVARMGSSISNRHGSSSRASPVCEAALKQNYTLSYRPGSGTDPLDQTNTQLAPDQYGESLNHIYDVTSEQQTNAMDMVNDPNFWVEQFGSATDSRLPSTSPLIQNALANSHSTTVQPDFWLPDVFNTETDPQHTATPNSLAQRLDFVAEQAKLANFETLDALIMAYYSSMDDTLSEALAGEKSMGQRLPRLIVTIRHAVREWKDWERRGFPLD